MSGAPPHAASVPSSRKLNRERKSLAPRLAAADKNYPMALVNLACSMMSTDPKKRPGLHEIRASLKAIEHTLGSRPALAEESYVDQWLDKLQLHQCRQAFRTRQ